jgi:hypothetical protein
MRAIGMLTTAALGALAVAAATVFVRMIPDIQRYVKMRSM